MAKVIILSMLALASLALLSVPSMAYTVSSDYGIITQVTLDNVNLYPNSSYFPHDFDVQQGSIRTISVNFVPNSSMSGTFLIGLTIGENITRVGAGSYIVSGPLCNGGPTSGFQGGCYENTSSTEPFFRAISNDKWIAELHRNPGEPGVGTIRFNFRSAVFQTGKNYDVIVSIWNETNTTLDPATDRLDTVLIKQAIKITNFLPAPQGSNLTITGIEPSDTEPALGDTIKVTIRVKNTGITTLNSVFVGLSLVQGGVSCNKNCYADGLGSYAQMGPIESGDEQSVTRLFTIRQDSGLVSGANATSAIFLATANTQQFIPASSSLGTGQRNINILNPNIKLLACPVSITASSPTAYIGSIVTYKAFIKNYRAENDFYIGMSIGSFQANDSTDYTQSNLCNTPNMDCPPLIVPCNTKCYADGLPPLVFLEDVPTNMTDPVTRKFTVPDYFPVGQPFDLVVGVWKSKDVVGNKTFASGPICYTYFKNITTVVEGQPIDKAIGGALNSVMTGAASIGRESVGSESDDVGKNLAWLVIIVAIPDILIFYYGRNNQHIIHIILAWTLLSIIAGGVAGFVNWGIVIVVVMIAIGLIINIVTKGAG